MAYYPIPCVSASLFEQELSYRKQIESAAQYVEGINSVKFGGSWTHVVWVEEANPGAIQNAMTDGLVEVIGVSCKLLLCDDVSMGRVSSNGSNTWSSWQDLGRTQHFKTRDYRIYGQFVHYCLSVQLGHRT